MTRSNHEPSIIAPEGALVTGGRAEAFEQTLQDALIAGQRILVIDLDAVTQVDSSGIRALVRGYTTALRIGGTVVFARPRERLRKLLHITRLDAVFTIYDSPAAALSGVASRPNSA